MRVVSVLSQKGGAGKTTLTVHWAVEAERHGGRAVIIDRDPQASSSRWFQRRQAATPILIQTPDLAGALAACRESGIDVVLIDTAPHAEAAAAEAARAADIVVIPSRPSVLDLEAIGATVRIIEAVKRPGVVVLNACPARSPVVLQARKALSGYGLPVCPVEVGQRAALQHALVDGLAVAEFDESGKAAREIARSWRWIMGGKHG